MLSLMSFRDKKVTRLQSILSFTERRWLLTEDVAPSHTLSSSPPDSNLFISSVLMLYKSLILTNGTNSKKVSRSIYLGLHFWAFFWCEHVCKYYNKLRVEYDGTRQGSLVLIGYLGNILSAFPSLCFTPSIYPSLT